MRRIPTWIYLLGLVLILALMDKHQTPIASYYYSVPTSSVSHIGINLFMMPHGFSMMFWSQNTANGSTTFLGSLMLDPEQMEMGWHLLYGELIVFCGAWTVLKRRNFLL